MPEKRIERNSFEAVIEAVILHLKQQFRMKINYFFEKRKAQTNALLLAAWNLKKFLERKKQNLSFLLLRLY